MKIKDRLKSRKPHLRARYMRLLIARVIEKAIEITQKYELFMGNRKMPIYLKIEGEVHP